MKDGLQADKHSTLLKSYMKEVQKHSVFANLRRFRAIIYLLLFTPMFIHAQLMVLLFLAICFDITSISNSDLPAVLQVVQQQHDSEKRLFLRLDKVVML